MPIPDRDTELVQIRDRKLLQVMDEALADTALRAGPWLACRPGCTHCCHGAFAINSLDAARLVSGMHAIVAADPGKAEAIRTRAQAWIDQYSPDFPGDPATGNLGTSEPEQARFEDFANDAPCPALNPETGLCDVYAWRPMTCRVFGPPVRVAEGDALGCCELCFIGATDDQIAACEMHLPNDLEDELVKEIADPGETVVAFALLR